MAEPPLAAATQAGRHPGAVALFESEPKTRPVVDATPLRPQGRILPSLADVEPIAPAFEEPAAPPRRKRERLAPTAKPETRAKKDLVVEFRPPSRPEPKSPDPVSATPSSRSFEEPIVAWRAPSKTAVAAKRTAKARSADAKSEPEIATAEPLAARTLAAAESTAIPEALAEAETVDLDGARQARHRRILERYVLGAELKPGERWKRRLQKTRK